MRVGRHFQHFGHGGGLRVRLGGVPVPEQGRDGAGDDGEAREVPAEGGAHCDREGDVVAHPGHADQRDRADQGAEDDGDDGLASQWQYLGGRASWNSVTCRSLRQ